MAAEAVRARLLLWATAFAAAAAFGLPPAGGVAPAAVAGPGIGLALFVALAGGLPRLPRRRAGSACVRSAYLIGAAGFEELIWRGVALGLLARSAGPLAALCLTSIGFAAWHLRALGSRCAVHCVTGLAFGLAYLLGGLLAAVLAHGVYNVLVDLSVQAAAEGRA